MGALQNRLKHLRQIGLFTCIALSSNITFADSEGLEASSGAVEWIVDYLTSFAIVAMGMLIITKLFQIQFQDRDWREVIKPILITSAIIGVKVAAPALVTAMGSSPVL